MDTEAASFHRFHDRIYLLQLSSRRRDGRGGSAGGHQPGAAGDRHSADPEVEIVFHDADYDLRLLEPSTAFGRINLFDTRIAAQLLNEPGVGLAALLEKYLGVRLDKRYPAGRLVGPAALARDAGVCGCRHSPSSGAARSAPRSTCVPRAGWSGPRRSLRWRRRTGGQPPENDEPGYLRMKGAKALPARSLAVLRELFQWRDQLARRTDKAAFRILEQRADAGHGEVAASRPGSS